MLEQPAFLFAPHLTEYTFCPHAFLRRPPHRLFADHGRDPRSCERATDLLHEVRGRAASAQNKMKIIINPRTVTAKNVTKTPLNVTMRAVFTAQRSSASQCSDVTSAFWRNGAGDRWDSCHATLSPSRGIGCHGTLIRPAVARPHTRARAPSSSTISAPSLSTR